MLVAVLGTVLLAGCGGAEGPVSGVVTGDTHGFAGAPLDQPYVVPSVPLQGTRGSVDLARDGAPVDVVFFGYSHCPDICQVVMGTLASAYAKLSPAQQRQVRVAFVTTDPRRDTTTVLRGYLRRFDPAFLGLTGSIDDIDRLAKPLHIYVKQGQRLPSGGYDVTHGTSVLAVQHGRATLVWSADVSPSALAHDLTKLLKET